MCDLDVRALPRILLPCQTIHFSHTDNLWLYDLHEIIQFTYDPSMIASMLMQINYSYSSTFLQHFTNLSETRKLICSVRSIAQKMLEQQHNNIELNNRRRRHYVYLSRPTLTLSTFLNNFVLYFLIFFVVNLVLYFF